MKGRKPTPTQIRLVNGNPGRRPLPKGEAQPPRDLPRPPKHIQGLARKEWRRISPLLYDAGLLTNIDSRALEAYCQSYATWCEAQEELRRTGTVIASSRERQPIVSPYLKVANIAWQQWTRMLTEFGMTPSSRSRAAATKAKNLNPFEEFRNLRKRG